MPSLGKYEHHHKTKTNEVYEFNGACSVDSSGVFTIVIPQDLVTSAEAIGAKVLHQREKWRLTHHNLEQAKLQVRLAIEEHMKVDISVERIIAYSSDMKVSFWETVDGTILPNGACDKNSKKGTWSNVGDARLNATNGTKHFSVGLFAAVYDRVTFTRGLSSTVTYQYPERGEGKVCFPWGEESKWGKLLNGFSSLHGPDPKYIAQMPYTEAAAKFFHDTLIGMCLLARNLDGFFKDGERLALAIEKQVPLLAHTTSAPAGQ